jgi:hypothetical protein
MDDFILPQLFSPQYVLAPERQHSVQHQSDVFFGDIGVQKTAKGDARLDQVELSAQTEIFFLVYRVGSEPGHVTLAVGRPEICAAVCRDGGRSEKENLVLIWCLQIPSNI